MIPDVRSSGNSTCTCVESNEEVRIGGCDSVGNYAQILNLLSLCFKNYYSQLFFCHNYYYWVTNHIIHLAWYCGLRFDSFWFTSLLQQWTVHTFCLLWWWHKGSYSTLLWLTFQVTNMHSKWKIAFNTQYSSKNIAVTVATSCSSSYAIYYQICKMVINYLFRHKLWPISSSGLGI